MNIQDVATNSLVSGRVFVARQLQDTNLLPSRILVVGVGVGAFIREGHVKSCLLKFLTFKGCALERGTY